MLAAVHRSVTPPASRSGVDLRESDHEDWWRPRAERVARYVAEELSSSDVVLLQEWWDGPEHAALFDARTGHLFERVSCRRPGFAAVRNDEEGASGQRRRRRRRRLPREDGQAVLVRRRGRFEIASAGVATTPTSSRVAQIVRLRERSDGLRDDGAPPSHLLLANVHLSFPGGDDPGEDAARRVAEIAAAVDALDREAASFSSSTDGDDDDDGGRCLQIVAGDFNDGPRGPVHAFLEERRFCDCAGAIAERSLASSVGGEIGSGVTHRTHRGEEAAVDHVFVRAAGASTARDDASRRLGWLGDDARVVDHRARSRDSRLSDDDESLFVSDHRPVTAVVDWENARRRRRRRRTDDDDDALHPLESPWNS